MTVPRSKIAWTDYSGGDSGFCLGCTKVSPGCAHCYAEAIYRRFGRDFTQVTIHEDKLRRLAQARFEPGDKPFRRGPGSRPMVFVCDMSDLFHETIHTGFIGEAITAMAGRPDVDWQILTKRAGRLAEFAKWQWPSNIWLGVSAENQAMADLRIPLLLQVPAAVRFVSCEPLLGPIHLGPENHHVPHESMANRTTDWFIVGAESGPHRRPFDPAWARGLRDQCQSAGVPFFYKQGSALRPGQDATLDGREHKEWPT